ncbi:MAG: hypothetical protein K8W52_18500, partial [Deltaproteobacteria bacterium]|nr:hypothetical protein [Deltaproteobacteria bacterium]
ASAQARGGHRDAAITTLVTLAATEPRLVAWRVVVDPDLMPLGDAPALRALDAKTPGTATGPALTTLGVAASPELGLYARVATLGNSMAEDAGSSSLEIVDVATGRVLIREGAISGPALERGLRALGMSTDGIARITLDSDGGKRKGVFPGTRLGVVMASDHARVVTGNRVLGEVALPTGYGAWAAWLPFGVLVASQISIGDGCGGYDYEEAALIPLTAAPPAPAKPAKPAR